MKRLTLLLVIASLLIVVGCSEEVEAINPPSNLEIVEADGLEITIGWDESTTADIDGYIVYLGTNAIDTVGTVAVTNITPLTLGTITLKAYKGDNTSDASNGVMTTVVTASNQTIYDYDITAQPSGYGWDENGTGTVYNFTQQDSLVIDIYLDKDFYLASPSTYTKYNTSYIQRASSDVAVAPATGYGNAEYPYEDSIYVVKLPSHGPGNDEQYLKLKLTNVITDSLVTFEYTFQPLEKYLRFE
jgi:hypothetical protein